MKRSAHHGSTAGSRPSSELFCTSEEEEDWETVIEVGTDEAETRRCPSCNMPFDKGKKRRVVDSCGHERCFACLCTSEGCPLCRMAADRGGSALSLFGSEMTSSGGSGGSRNRVKTNGHFTASMQQRQTDNATPTGRPRPSPSKSSRTSLNSVMTQSCPAPQQQPKSRFFPSPAAFRSARSSSRPPQHQILSASTSGAVSQESVASTESWGSGFYRKLKNLWSGSTGEKGLNQLNTDDEDTTPVTTSKRISRKKSSVMTTSTPAPVARDNDLQARLRLWLGDGPGSGSLHRLPPGGCSSFMARRQRMQHRDDYASLASLDVVGTGGSLSCNTSPVSTLTGSSDAAAGVGASQHGEPSSESIGSLLSVSGHSTASSSHQRRHSLTGSHPSADDISTGFTQRRSSVRRSARSDSIQRLPPHPAPVTTAAVPSATPPLRPLFFEVPQTEADPLFLGRRWLFRQLLEKTTREEWRGALVMGNQGTGKTAFLLQLVEHSCFGRRHTIYNRPNETGNSSLGCEELLGLGGMVVGYHFCQSDNNVTCLVPEFIHSLAAQLCQAPQLAAYRDLLLSEAHLQSWVSMRECIASPDRALCRGILEPLTSLSQQGRVLPQPCLLLVDALGEAEYHRPDHGDALPGFLAKHLASFPPWLKLVTTVRTQLQEVARQLPLDRISLDRLHANEYLQRDILEYIQFRVKNSPSIQNNISSPSGSLSNSLSGSLTGSLTQSLDHGQSRFAQYLCNLAQGSFLFAKLTLDLVETGHLVAKAAGYRVLPTSLHQLFLLRCNLRFPTESSFDKTQSLLAVCLASLYPLSLLEMYHSVVSLQNNQDTWDCFLEKFKLLSGFLVKRMDNTFMFFHPSFREWLMRREEGDSNKFLCDLRQGHMGIALRLSKVQAPLDPEQTLELGHHLLKAHIYRNVTSLPEGLTSRDLQALWLLHSSKSTSEALCCARNVHSPNVKVSRLLLLAGADANARTDLLGGAPALCAAAHLGLVEIVRILLEFRADPKLPDSRGAGPLSLAAATGHEHVCAILLMLPGSEELVGAADDTGRCALVHAAVGGHLAAVRSLLSTIWGSMTLDQDIKVGSWSWAEEKARENSDCKHGTRVSRSEAEHQALVGAASHGQAHVVQYLLENTSISLDRHDSLLGETALTAAAAGGHVTTCETLLNRGASLVASNSKGLPPLSVAVREGHWAPAELLLTKGAPIEQADPQGKTALMLAAAEGHLGLLELLLEKGAGLTRGDREGVTALGHACQRGRLVAAKLLIDRGADVNAADKCGRTSLDMAACQGNPELVQLLLECGALVEHVDANGLRPLDRAIACRNAQVVQCFLRRRACLGPATWQAAQGKPEIMLLLLGRLLEDGNVLYKKGRLQEAAGRYNYAIKKLPEPSPHASAAFLHLHLQLLLNLSRCSRKMNDCDEAVRLAECALSLRPDSYEALFARARARLDQGRPGDSLTDVNRALALAPQNNRDARRVLNRLKEEIREQLQAALD